MGIERLERKPLEQGEFTFEHWDKNIEGYSNPNLRWNGWACPFFEKEQALEVLEASSSESVYDFQFVEMKNGSKLIVVIDDDRQILNWEMQKIMTVDGEKELYAIGYFMWCWERV